MGSHDAGFDSMIRQELAVLAATPDTYLLHEHLEDYNEPLYFHQFVDRAAAKNLQYLGEAQITVMLASRLGPEIEKTLRHISPDLLQMEQYMDFLRNRMFRQTLLCHDNVKLDHALRPEAVQRMWIASPAKPVSDQPDLQSDAPEQFSTGDSAPRHAHDPRPADEGGHDAPVANLARVDFVRRFAGGSGAGSGDRIGAFASVGDAIAALLHLGAGGVLALASAVCRTGLGSTVGQSLRTAALRRAPRWSTCGWSRPY